MENADIAIRLRCLNNMIRRYFFNSPSRKEVDRITDNNGWIIGFLAENEGRDIYQKDIEDHFTIAKSTTSKVLGLMEEKGFIRRLPVKADARLKKIVLTDKARDIHAMMAENKKEMEHCLLRGFTEEEMRDLARYLDRMKVNISEAQNQ